jgi:hypothetical protein
MTAAYRHASATTTLRGGEFSLERNTFPDALNRRIGP